MTRASFGFRTLAPAAIAALLLAGHAHQASAQEQVVKIGHSGPLSGPNAFAGKDNENGVRLAVEELNAKKIVVEGKTLKFELVSEDDQCDARTGVSVAQKLVDSGVKFVMGPYCSGVAIPASRVYNDGGAMVSTVGTNPKVTEGGYKNLFRIIASDTQIGSNMAVYAAQVLKVKQVAVIDDRTAFAMARRLTREEGLFVGGSTGLLMHVALQVAREVDDPDACVVAILCDTGERYLSKLYNDEWLRENRLIEPARVTADLMVQTKESDRAPGALVSVEPSTPVRRALGFINEYNISQLPVMEGDQVVGSIQENEVMRLVMEKVDLGATTIGTVMGRPFPTLSADADVTDACYTVAEESGAVLVVADRRPVGVLTKIDFIHYLADVYKR